MNAEKPRVRWYERTGQWARVPRTDVEFADAHAAGLTVAELAETCHITVRAVQSRVVRGFTHRTVLTRAPSVGTPAGGPDAR